MSNVCSHQCPVHVPTLPLHRSGCCQDLVQGPPAEPCQDSRICCKAQNQSLSAALIGTTVATALGVSMFLVATTVLGASALAALYAALSTMGVVLAITFLAIAIILLVHASHKETKPTETSPQQQEYNKLAEENQQRAELAYNPSNNLCAESQFTLYSSDGCHTHPSGEDHFDPSSKLNCSQLYKSHGHTMDPAMQSCLKAHLKFSPAPSLDPITAQQPHTHYLECACAVKVQMDSNNPVHIIQSNNDCSMSRREHMLSLNENGFHKDLLNMMNDSPPAYTER